MPVLKLNHYGTKEVMRRHGLRELPMIGRGMFCAVFDNGDTVLKLTADHIQYSFYTDYCRPKGAYYPTLVENHGMVGEQDEHILYLIEMEKLTKIKRRADCPDRAWMQRRLVMEVAREHRTRLQSKFWHIRQPPIYHSELSAAVLTEMSKDKRLDEELSEVCYELSMFACNYGSSFDLQRSNFMLRGDQLVFNDVMADISSICAHNSRRRC